MATIIKMVGKPVSRGFKFSVAVSKKVSMDKTPLFNDRVYYTIVWLKSKQKLDFLAEFYRIFISEFRKGSLIQSIADPFHQLIVEIQIMHHR